ncbi:peptidoglycan DD-metalloendopeptidase family protein [Campylobacter hyointestinalis]|uniref:peptidoglycan DD-metalloendopeptidase family protein n=1 Tax=Campylobacter hyointestinalis TaxID=198 RepID=UPI0007C90FF4|nr:peptidoglycan DD-metalloendopeptidase family protein [Campylobacter hyointestinalis]ANE32709.1 zinc metallopeptidase, M23 family [Campylobacter hyointestinalis subsp. hyointestinalis LMG 9260]MBT0611627.1 peptidoglycan DD-metalloendopeptidase family protein [Campylobacter hyointestinalis subsp. hyointestinalis]MDL2346700.1 peptidoglycan DD-metalloendopeptidase family protein [Campylobacter hyointestinalis]MDL2348689.1 peptidoglycan DD-metalloendopeptidase family protein [Campylobacter hyoint
MKNKFIITITDINGSKNYLLHQLIKKIVVYIMLIAVVSFFIGLAYISYLENKTDSLKQKRDELTKIKNELFLENEKMQEKLAASSEEFAAIEDKIALLEDRLGLNTDNNITMESRLETLILTSSQKQLMFSMIPNGEVIKSNGISAEFGWRSHPILNKKEFHQGVDLRADIGTPIYAPADGVIEFAGYNNGGFGYLVIIEHNFGFKTRFAHMSRKDVVKEGEFVKKGDLIGYSGNTGLSTGPHLHYEIRFIQRPLDPINFIKWNSKNYEEIFNKEQRVSWQSLVNTLTTLMPKQQ